MSFHLETHRSMPCPSSWRSRRTRLSSNRVRQRYIVASHTQSISTFRYPSNVINCILPFSSFVIKFVVSKKMVNECHYLPLNGISNSWFLYEHIKHKRLLNWHLYKQFLFSQCNSEVVQPSAREDHVEPESGVRYTEARVDISRDHVEEYFGEFHCACVAISGKGSVVSRHALVTYACKFIQMTSRYCCCCCFYLSAILFCISG